jgi:hypothetical protein
MQDGKQGFVGLDSLLVTIVVVLSVILGTVGVSLKLESDPTKGAPLEIRVQKRPEEPMDVSTNVPVEVLKGTKTGSEVELPEEDSDLGEEVITDEADEDFLREILERDVRDGNLFEGATLFTIASM